MGTKYFTIFWETSMNHFYQQIDGFMNKRNICLFDKVIEMMPDNCQWVELGSWTGKSAAYCVVELINKNKFGKFTTIDSWGGCEILKEHELVQSNVIKNVFLKNMAPVIEKINLIQDISWTASSNFDDSSIDFCYVDAGHSYEDVTKDLNAWWPKIKPGKYFGGDDYTTEFSGLMLAVEDFFKDKKVKIETVGRCWLVQKPLN